MSQELAIVEELAVSQSMTASALCTLFSMCAKRLWIAFAVLIVFDCVLDDNGAFKAAYVQSLP